ncbi:MAG: TonB-dependent receptor plug domain-containing protein, partial [Flavisolibacter sp.]
MKKMTQCLFALLCFTVLSIAASAQEKKTVTGTIKDNTGNPLFGATVTEKGTTNSVVSGETGAFTIRVSPNATLSITYVGYVAKEIQVNNQSHISVVLAAGETNLSEVVVTALGIQKQQKSLGYATSTVKARELTLTAPTNLGTALYGKAPGVRIATAPGGSLGGVAIQIRGINSLFGRTQPLIVMDGVPIHDGDFNNNNYWGDQRIRGNGLIDINPEDVESLTVLKGASAAALYGSEATNGVILITTKSGKGNKGFTVDFNATYFQDRVAYLPRFQNVRGAGSPVQYDVYGEDANGFNKNKYTINGQSYRALVQGSLNFGPAFDGQ